MEEGIVGALATANKDHARGVVLECVVEKIGMILATVVMDLSAAMDIIFVLKLNKVEIVRILGQMIAQNICGLVPLQTILGLKILVRNLAEDAKRVEIVRILILAIAQNICGLVPLPNMLGSKESVRNLAKFVEQGPDNECEKWTLTKNQKILLFISHNLTVLL